MYICEKELIRAIHLLKESKAINQSGMIAEYIKAVGERDSNNLRMLLNEWRMHAKGVEGE